MTQPNHPKPRPRNSLKSWIVGGILAIVALLGLSAGVGGFLVIVGLIALITGTYALATGRRTWAAVPSRPVAAGVTAAALVVTLIGGGVYGAENPDSDPVAAPTPTVTATSSEAASSTPTPTVEPVDDETPLDPETVVSPTAAPSVPVADAAATDVNALALLDTLAVKGRAPKTGYDRAGKFGTAWLDVDRNGCDTRNDILARDLSASTLSGPCKVITGMLSDPYTGKTIDFTRGVDTSRAVQIDHVVALMDAWQKGAQQLSQDQRVALANDPMNLMAVDGPTNAQKGASDAASWLPPNKSFRCEYVARQVSVKATYKLWVTAAEKTQIASVLSNCQDQRSFTSPFAPVAPKPAPPAPKPAPPAPKPAPPAPKPAPPAPKPAPPAPKPAPPANPSVVHPGSFCSTAGATGVTKKGTPMVCKTTSSDSRLRWRAA
ncbi:Protein of unknown function [Paramicrobacterium humi]|uniref:GmrSD restriction endonucleases C-terminal domain-containing protein n=1 Tax=Paramicrobacterium humi TaxID=640635 RepID=A0A1H4ISR2_9MICO|nr:HNH endonuclease family protein [Microbacterium humi]SEB37134.1 Protein of unknown function [Microbacterium humi]